jgi:TPR repeat protein
MWRILSTAAIALMRSSTLALAQPAKPADDAIRKYRAAAEKGDAKAQVELGNLYAQQEKYAEALPWFRKAADQGNAEAQNDVGFFLLTGMGAAQDPVEGMRWLRKAADQGNEVAQRNIGMAYLQGIGVKPDRAEAIRWFKKAAEKGDEDAKQALKLLGVRVTPP